MPLSVMCNPEDHNEEAQERYAASKQDHIHDTPP